MYKSSYEVEILINGKPAKEYRHEDKVYIEGRQGTRFSIKIRNNSFSRKLFVPTVDGLSVMNGEEGSYKSSGYIVKGYDSITIDGWRTSDKDVAEFFFSSPEGSYRKEMDKGNNIGMIGVAVFDEVYRQPVYTISPCYHTHYAQTTNYPYWTNTCGGVNGCTIANAGGGGGGATQGGGVGSGTSGLNSLTAQFNASNNIQQAGNIKSAMCSANVGSSPAQALGTGFGDQKHSEVTSVSFERVSSPDVIFEIHYNTREELEKAGICFKKEPLYVTPSAFPGQYCKPPKTCSCNGITTGCTRSGCPSKN